LKKTWISRVSGLENWPRNIVVKAESESKAMDEVLNWLMSKRLKRKKGSDNNSFREFSSWDIEVEEALDLGEQREIDEWLEGSDFDLWKSFVNETRE